MRAKAKIILSFLVTFSTLLLANKPLRGSGQCVIITTSSWSSAFSNFITARTTQGTTTFIYTLEDIEANYGGSDLPEKIRNYIIDASSNDVFISNSFRRKFMVMFPI
ncbi:hypothetical protein GTN66_07370 [bacterium]|nr:hypothetical protein [bacterium]NIN93285.1 hypothetical protein [bacterium]NIO19080.1 hypothetical protein [bacterium]NIO74211.1 hypothetical protein [bacterium]